MRSALLQILCRDANLLTNGTFSNDTAGWPLAHDVGGASFTSVVGVGRVGLAGSGSAIYSQATKTVIGRTYRATGNMPGTTGTVGVYMCRKSDDANPVTNIVTLRSGAGAINNTFTATATVSYISCQINATTAATGDFDDLRVIPV